MQKNINMTDKNSRQYHESQRSMARYALLLVMVFTAVNLVLLLSGARQYMLFSASLPYYFTAFSRALDGGSWGSYSYTAVAASAVILVCYCVCWKLGENRPGWLLTATILFSVDTVVLVLVQVFLFGDPLADVLDYIIHGWVLYQLIVGFRSARKLNGPEFL